ncbi:MAG TPA: TetR/AcrR family transcriptional regulator, partial [Euzebyales bacterium]|nr:TetR/AcrR family transcriptional regulator [Euzebyales bacterium]
ERPGRGPTPGLSVERIVRAAIEVAQRDGLAGVSMNRVAAELDTAAMSLYRYVSSKEELVALMVDEANGSPPPPPEAGDDWRSALTAWAHAHLAAYHAHPWLVHAPISGPPIMPNSVAWFDGGLRCFTGTALHEDEKVGVILVVSGLVRNQATLEMQLEAAMRSADSEAVMTSYGQLLVQLTDADRFPALHAGIAAGVFDGEDVEDDLAFEFGLELILDGIAALIRQRRADEGRRH